MNHHLTLKGDLYLDFIKIKIKVHCQISNFILPINKPIKKLITSSSKLIHIYVNLKKNFRIHFRSFKNKVWTIKWYKNQT